MKYLALLVALLVFPFGASAAALGITPAARSVTTGDLVTLRVYVNTQGESINQGELTLRFPTDYLEVVSLSKSSSIFSLWVEEPSYSNTAGTVSLNGGVPTPGYTGADGSVVSVTFHTKRAGTASVTLADAAVRANDGLGTDVLDSSTGASIVIADAVQAPAPVTPAPTPTPQAPVSGVVSIQSATHPMQDAWYANNSPLFTWKLPASADAVQLIAADDPNETPSVLYKSSVTEKQVEDLTDGTWYFNLRYRTSGSWSKVSTYRVNIDTTAPKITAHTFSYDPAERSLALSAEATDGGSGIVTYELAIDDEEVVELSSDSFSEGPYLVSVRKPGQHTVTLTAVDRAGNRTDVTESFSVPRSVLDTEVFALGSFSVSLMHLLVFMALISLLSLASALVTGYLLYARHGAPATRKRGNRQVVHRAFGLIRQDLDKHVRALRRARDGKELTKAEGELGTQMHKDLNDLERYLLEHTDLLD